MPDALAWLVDAPVPWATVVAGGVAVAAGLSLSWRAGRGARVRTGVWLCLPLAVVGVAAIESAVLGHLRVPGVSEVLSAAAYRSDVARVWGLGLSGAAVVASLLAWLPALSWRAAFGRVPTAEREAARGAMALSLGAAAVVASAAVVLGGWSLLTPALLVPLLALPALGARAGLGSTARRPDVRTRGPGADRATLALAALSLPLATLGFRSLAQASAFRAVAARGAGEPVDLGLLTLTYGLGTSASWVLGLGGLALVVTLLVRRLGLPLQPGLPRVRPDRWAAGLAGLSLVLVGATLASRAHRPFLDFADQIDDVVSLSALPAVPASAAAGGEVLLDEAGVPRPLAYNTARLFRAQAAWVDLTEDDEEAASPKLLPDEELLLAMPRWAPARAILTSKLFRADSGVAWVVSTVDRTDLDGNPALVAIPIEVLGASGVERARAFTEREALCGPLVPLDDPQCADLASSAPPVAYPGDEDVVLAAQGDDTVSDVVQACVAARRAGAQRCVLVSDAYAGLARRYGQGSPGSSGG